MENKIFHNSISLFKRNPITSIFLGLFISIILAGVMMISLLTPFGIIILIPVVILPFLFAVSSSFLDMIKDKSITAKRFFNYLFAYFSLPNISTFRFWKSLFFSLIFYLAMLLIMSPISMTIARNIDPVLFEQFYYEITTNIQAVIENFSVFYQKYYSILLNIAIYGQYIPFCVFMLVIFFNISISSLSFYIRRSTLKINPLMIGGLYSSFIKKYRWNYYKNYLRINFPIYILLILGNVGGFFLAYFLDMKEYSLAFALLLGVGGMTLYSPIYFTNQMALATNYLPKIADSYNSYVLSAINAALNNPRISEEDKNKLQAMLNDMNNKENIDNNNSNIEEK